MKLNKYLLLSVLAGGTALHGNLDEKTYLAALGTLGFSASTFLYVTRNSAPSQFVYENGGALYNATAGLLLQKALDGGVGMVPDVAGARDWLKDKTGGALYCNPAGSNGYVAKAGAWLGTIFKYGTPCEENIRTQAQKDLLLEADKKHSMSAQAYQAALQERIDAYYAMYAKKFGGCSHADSLLAKGTFAAQEDSGNATRKMILNYIYHDNAGTLEQHIQAGTTPPDLLKVVKVQRQATERELDGAGQHQRRESLPYGESGGMGTPGGGSGFDPGVALYEGRAGASTF